MEAEWVVEVLEHHWDRLPAELGEQWQDFAISYCGIIARLPSEARLEDQEEAADALCELLSRSTYGHGLLHGYRARVQERLLADPSTTLSDEESIRQVCNRFRELQARLPQRTRENAQTGASPEPREEPNG